MPYVAEIIEKNDLVSGRVTEITFFRWAKIGAGRGASGMSIFSGGARSRALSRPASPGGTPRPVLGALADSGQNEGRSRRPSLVSGAGVDFATAGLGKTVEKWAAVAYTLRLSRGRCARVLL